MNFIHHAKNKLKICHVEDCPFCKILLLPAEIEIQSPRLARLQSMECGHGGMRDANDHRVCHNRHNTHYAMDASDYLTAITTARPCHNPSSWRPGAIHQLNYLFSIYINLYLKKIVFLIKFHIPYANESHINNYPVSASHHRQHREPHTVVITSGPCKKS